MRAVRAALLVGAVTILLWANPAIGGHHDRDCMAPASPQEDAFWSWVLAVALTDFDCTGELGFPDDDDDWYTVTAPLANGIVRLCPSTPGFEPWHPDLQLYVRATATPVYPYHFLFPPGPPLGVAHEVDGCEEASAPPQLFGPNTRLYINVHRTTGDGLYNLVVT